MADLHECTSTAIEKRRTLITGVDNEGLAIESS